MKCSLVTIMKGSSRPNNLRVGHNCSTQGQASDQTVSVLDPLSPVSAQEPQVSVDSGNCDPCPLLQWQQQNIRLLTTELHQSLCLVTHISVAPWPLHEYQTVCQLKWRHQIPCKPSKLNWNLFCSWSPIHSLFLLLLKVFCYFCIVSEVL